MRGDYKDKEHTIVLDVEEARDIALDPSRLLSYGHIAVGEAAVYEPQERTLYDRPHMDKRRDCFRGYIIEDDLEVPVAATIRYPSQNRFVLAARSLLGLPPAKARIDISLLIPDTGPYPEL